MSDILSSIGGVFNSGTGSGIAKLAELGLTGAGLIGNISAEKQRSDILNQLKSSEAQLNNPQALATKVASMTQPLNQNLVASVENATNADLAERGLSESPGISQTVTSQALAPYEQQNQSTALQLLMQALGLPVEYGYAMLQGLPQNVNLAPLLALLFNSKSPTAIPTIPTIPMGPAPGEGTIPYESAPTFPGGISL